jgi:phage terminase small subunit
MGPVQGGRRIGRVSRKPAKPGDRSAELTPQQRLFVHEYMLDRNGKQAAIRAGYSPDTAESQASRLLRNVKVAALVEQRLQRLTEKTELKLERVVLELHRILLADPADALNDDGSVKPLREWPEDLRRALSGLDVDELWEGRGEDREQVGVTKKVRFWSKTEASSQLLRVLGAFKDRLEVTEKPYHELVAEAARRRREQQATGGET